MTDFMNLFEVYCNGSKPRGFRPATLCMDVDELTKYVSCSLKADDAELLCAQFDIDVPDNKQSTAKKLASLEAQLAALLRKTSKTPKAV